MSNNLIDWSEATISICFKRNIFRALESLPSDVKFTMSQFEEPEDYPYVRNNLLRKIRKHFNIPRVLFRQYSDSYASALLNGDDEKDRFLRALYFIDTEKRKRRILIFWDTAEKFGEAKYNVKIEE